jgi:hypothetical protein
VWAEDYLQSAIWGCQEAYHLRKWGYVFWDQERLKASGVMKLTYA